MDTICFQYRDILYDSIYRAITRNYYNNRSGGGTCLIGEGAFSRRQPDDRDLVEAAREGDGHRREVRLDLGPAGDDDMRLAGYQRIADGHGGADGVGIHQHVGGIQANARRQTALYAGHVLAFHGRQERADPLRGADDCSDRERPRPLASFVAGTRTQYDHAHYQKQRQSSTAPHAAFDVS